MVFNQRILGAGGGSVEMCDLTLDFGKGVIYAYFGMDATKDSDYSAPTSPISVPIGSFVYTRLLNASAVPIVSGVSSIGTVLTAAHADFIYAITSSTASIAAYPSQSGTN